MIEIQGVFGECGILLPLGGDTMVTIDSQFNKQLAKHLSLKGMALTRAQQKQILDVMNNKKEITNELIRQIALNNEV